MATYYLGLDGGGTKTAACILDADRRELGRGQGGPCNIATGPLESLRESVLTAARQALLAASLPPDTRFEAVCAGVAGFTAKHRRAEFHRILTESIPANLHRVEPDFVVAFWGATEGAPGVIVIAGTGAVAYGRNEAGKSYRFDGRGFLVGDAGGGFYIGRNALQFTVLHLDFGRPPTPYTHAVMAATGAEDVDDLIEWAYRDFSPARIARLAETIGELARQGDEEAIRDLESAGSLLRAAAVQVVTRLGMDRDTPLYIAGSLWNEAPILEGSFATPAQHLGMAAGPVELIRPRHDPAFGAARLAMQGEGDA
jgi:N-acetylglucosamine kinase-like BadF-type ATPase